MVDNMKVAVVFNPKINNSAEVLRKIRASLDVAKLDYDVLELDSLKDGYDLACAIGGDGTILKTSRFFSKTATPVMGVNLGRLGFLSLFSSDENIGQIIKDGNYTLRERMMLKSSEHTALNDIVIKGNSGGRTSRFNLYINDNTLLM